MSPSLARAAARSACARAAALGTGLLLQACLVVPQTREVYDADCRVLTRQMTLETAVVGRLGSCAGDSCKVVLVATGAVTVASAVVSGSIALVGNVVYWLEKQGQCLRKDAVPQAAAAS